MSRMIMRYINEKIISCKIRWRQPHGTKKKSTNINKEVKTKKMSKEYVLKVERVIRIQAGHLRKKVH